MLPKIGKDQSMSAVEMMDGARTRVAWLVRREEVATGSRMVACENVGAMIGRSESWIRKLIGRSLDTKRPDAVALSNIYAVYSRLCERIETDAQRLERAAATDKQNAASASDHTVAESLVPPAPVDTKTPHFLRRVK